MPRSGERWRRSSGLPAQMLSPSRAMAAEWLFALSHQSRQNSAATACKQRDTSLIWRWLHRCHIAGRSGRTFLVKT